MTVRKKAMLAAFDKCLTVAERARLDRPEKIDWHGRPANRRRVGDVIRWKMNNKTIDQIKSDIKTLMQQTISTKR